VLVAAAASPALAAKRKDKAPEAPAAAPPQAPAPTRQQSTTAGKSAEPDAGGEIKRGERIEFDERLIQGQTAKAGALYLFDRKPSDLRSMVHERESYRGEIVRQIFPDQEGTP
jgi:hypothetical protein